MKPNAEDELKKLLATEGDRDRISMDLRSQFYKLNRAIEEVKTTIKTPKVVAKGIFSDAIEEVLKSNEKEISNKNFCKWCKETVIYPDGQYLSSCQHLYHRACVNKMIEAQVKKRDFQIGRAHV